MSFTITPRQAIAALGVLLAAAGFIALLLPVTVSTDEYSAFGQTEQVSCGIALTAPGDQPSCADAAGDRRMWAWPLAIAGIVAVAGAVLVQSQPRPVDTE